MGSAMRCGGLATWRVHWKYTSAPTLRTRSATNLARRKGWPCSCHLNPLIAERLDISPTTAEHHVCSILSKLDVTTHAAAAVWAVRQNEGPPRCELGSRSASNKESHQGVTNFWSRLRRC